MSTANRRPFGTTEDGSSVEAVAIAGGSLSAEVLNWGAVIRDLRIDGRPHPLVLGFDDFASYVAHSRFFGAIAGRYANRIAGGRFELDGASYQLEKNFLGRHHLHGGTATFGGRLWTIAHQDADGVTLSLVSPDGEGGYPGHLDVSCRYALQAPACLRVELVARTNKPTIVNLAQHSYFNLDGHGSVRGHSLQISADRYLPVDEELMPTGEIRSVEGTPFDFRTLRLIGGGAGSHLPDYDHNFCLASAPRSEPVQVARLESSDRTVAMVVRTTEPGLQFFDGAPLDVPVPGLDGIRYGASAGLCLEAQRWPDSPNRPEFAGAVLRPGEAYRQVTEFAFLLI